jgi:hypothetical protein
MNVESRKNTGVGNQNMAVRNIVVAFKSPRMDRLAK